MMYDEQGGYRVLHRWDLFSVSNDHEYYERILEIIRLCLGSLPDPESHAENTAKWIQQLDELDGSVDTTLGS